MAILLDQVEDGTKLTKKELEYHKKTKLRDVALLTLLLGTGIRVSECVGLDINDVDFNNGGIKIRRKGGYEAIVYFGDEVETALLDYLEQREHIIPAEGHENALFLSLQNRRMAVRSVENLVKKYASRVTTLKKITPHKLRSTYGTELYKETRDIYLRLAWRIPSQRERPALPMQIFSASILPTWPIVARQLICTLRISPEGRRSRA